MVHRYILADRFEEITDPERMRVDVSCDRTIYLYGYNRGTYMRAGHRIHVPGVGDFNMDEVSVLDDPCPLPSKDKDKQKRRTLKAAEKTIYAPMSDVSGILFDKDATYIEIPDKHIVFSKPSTLFPGGVSTADLTEEQHVLKAREAVMDAQSGHTAAFSEGVALVKQLHDTDMAVDDQLQHSTMQLFSGSKKLTSHEYDAAKLRDIAREGGEDDEDESDESEDEEEADSEVDDEGDEEGASGSASGSEEESGSDEEEQDEEEAAGRKKAHMPAQQRVEQGGRVRRKAVFDDDDEKDEDDNKEDEEDDEEVDSEEERGKKSKSKKDQAKPRKHSDEAKAGKEEYNKKKKGIRETEKIAWADESEDEEDKLKGVVPLSHSHRASANSAPSHAAHDEEDEGASDGEDEGADDELGTRTRVHFCLFVQTAHPLFTTNSRKGVHQVAPPANGH